MGITISLDPPMQAELEAEASAWAISCEQMVCEAVGEYLLRAKRPKYDAWFAAKYEEGKAALERGDVCPHDEVRQDMLKRREKSF